MQRFAVSQKNHAEAITISPFLLSLPYRTENRRFSALSCTKTGSTQPKLSAACFVVQSCLADADFVVFSDYCLIGTRLKRRFFHLQIQNQVREGRRSCAVPLIFCASKTVSRVLYLTVIYLRAALPRRSSHPGSGRASLLLPYRCCSG